MTLLARFAGEPTPIKSTVTKAVAEFRRTHADTWNIQKDSFTEEQLEVMRLGFTLFFPFIKKVHKSGNFYIFTSNYQTKLDNVRLKKIQVKTNLTLPLTKNGAP